MTASQEKILGWLQHHPGFWAPAQIAPAGYPGGATSIGRVCSSLEAAGKVKRRTVEGGRLKYQWSAS